MKHYYCTCSVFNMGYSMKNVGNFLGRGCKHFGAVLIKILMKKSSLDIIKNRIKDGESFKM